MNRILAAVDNSLAATPVLATARSLAPVLDAEVQALHVTVDGDRIARQAAESAGVPISRVPGPIVPALVEAGRGADVVAVVIGARGTPAGARPLGGTALTLATSLPKPVVVVPPDTRPIATIARVLVPVEGRRSTGRTPRTIIQLARAAHLDMIAFHVYQEGSLPAFTDQPQYESDAWAQEFIRRYCRWHDGTVRLVTRVGRVGELVPAVAEEIDADLVALGWSQELGPGHAPVVRAVLARCRRPVLLVPVNPAQAEQDRPGLRAGGATHTGA